MIKIQIKTALFVLVIVLFSACKITRHAVVETQTVAVEQKDISVKTSELKLDNSVIEIDENTQVVITIYSPPDSTGKQYIAGIAEISKNKTATNKKNIVEAKEIVQTDKSKSAESTKITAKEDTKTETKTPGWLYVLVFILSSGIIVVIILILRKYKVL